MIGFPKGGKTTLLNALTRGRYEAAASGGARHEVQAGMARISDPRLDTLASIFSPEKLVPVEIKYLDVPAGSGTSGDGAGISGQLLNLVQSADALVHVVRAFHDPSVPHINGSVDSYRDAADMEAELAFSDLSILERRVHRVEDSLKGAKGHERDTLLSEGGLLQRLKEGLEKDIPVREQHVLPEENDILSNYQLLTFKPLLVVFNIDESAVNQADELQKEMGRRYDRPGLMSTTLCGKLEMELSQLNPDDEREFRDSLNLGDSGIDEIVRTSFDLLDLVTFFTYVSKEVRAWTVSADTPAVKAAGKIHSDMERGFIRAEVVAFDDLARCASLAQCKKEGLLRLEGKTYPVKDGDVITFLFNV